MPITFYRPSSWKLIESAPSRMTGVVDLVYVDGDVFRQEIDIVCLGDHIHDESWTVRGVPTPYTYRMYVYATQREKQVEHWYHFFLPAPLTSGLRTYSLWSFRTDTPIHSTFLW